MHNKASCKPCQEKCRHKQRAQLTMKILQNILECLSSRCKSLDPKLEILDSKPCDETNPKIGYLWFSLGQTRISSNNNSNNGSNDNNNNSNNRNGLNSAKSEM